VGMGDIGWHPRYGFLCVHGCLLCDRPVHGLGLQRDVVACCWKSDPESMKVF
jgi:hypothetical protein